MAPVAEPRARRASESRSLLTTFRRMWGRPRAAGLQPTGRAARRSRTANSTPGVRGGEDNADSQAGMVAAEAPTAMCVQRFDDSQSRAVHTTYRISLRSSSLREPRYPLLRVVSVVIGRARGPPLSGFREEGGCSSVCWVWAGQASRREERGPTARHERCAGGCRQSIDPSAGSPTETLLRLLLPLESKV